MKNKIALLFLIYFFSLCANAAIVDGGNFIQDTDTQLDWLKMSFTKGKSYNEIDNLINNDASFAGYGYEVASKAQLIVLLNNHYGANTIGLGPLHEDLNYNQSYQIVQLFGTTQEIQDSFINKNNTVDQYVTKGYIAETKGSGVHYTTELHARDFLINEERFFDRGFVKLDGNASGGNNNIGNEFIGAFLVRASVSSVPEPSTYMMMTLGLLCLLVRSRKKQAFEQY